MGDHSAPRWDAQGLAFGFTFGLLGLLFLIARHDRSLRPVHLLGVIGLAVGAALLLAALDRTWPDLDRVPDRASDTDPLELP